MAKILFSRILQVFMLAIFINTLCFIMMHSLPGDQAMQIAAGRYGPDGTSAEVAKHVAIELGLNKPLLSQYLDSLYQFMNFDLGYSLVSGQKVIDEISVQLTYSLILAFVAFLLSLVFAFPLGIYSGSKKNGFVDKFGFFISILFKAVPAFILALVLIFIFSIHFDLLPPAGFEDWRYFILPALTLALSLSAVSNRLIRESMLDVTNSSYFSYGKYKGLTNSVLIKRHGIKNALIPIIAFLSLQSIYLIEGVVIVESIFSFPGIGHALVHAVISRDIPMIQGTVLILSLLFVIINLLADLLSKILDPRLGIKHV